MLMYVVFPFRNYITVQKVHTSGHHFSTFKFKIDSITEIKMKNSWKKRKPWLIIKYFNFKTDVIICL